MGTHRKQEQKQSKHSNMTMSEKEKQEHKYWDLISRLETGEAN